MSVSIQEIPQFVFDELHALIGEKTKEKLFKHVLGDCLDPQAAFDLYIRKIMDTVFANDGDDVDLYEIKYSYRNKRQITKKNWLKQLEADPTPIEEELDVLQRLSETQSSLIKIENIPSSQQYILQRLKELEAWATDRESRLMEFPYLKTKQKFQIEKAIDNDIVHIICDFLKVHPKKNWISIRSEEMVEYPIFTDGLKKMKNVLYNSGTTIAYDDYKLSDDRVLRLLISADENDEVQLDKTFMLDETDSEIFELIMQQRDERFIKEKTITFDINPIVNRIYGNHGSKAYELLEGRLMKFHRFAIEGRTSGKDTKTTFAYNLFQSVKVIKSATAGIYGEVEFSDTLHQQLITNQTVKIYSHLIHRLENRMSKILIYAFQKERLDAHLHGRDVKQHFEYSFFTNRIRFRYKKIETNLKQITDSLQEFKNANILIKDFKRVGNGFNITLTPLSESEKADFFTGTSTPAMLDSERISPSEILEVTAIVQ
ncbi:hypothetical protein ACFPOG_12790 [Paenibacillus aestuarii]|uniref:Uncharacterized protein n=1 Tax=Paenibacillus aestuarii TaxID=516965 RepID=A0ABW0K815_9BACL